VTDQKKLENEGIDRELYDRLVEMIQEIRFGTITLVIQEKKIVQVEKNEKFRLK